MADDREEELEEDEVWAAMTNHVHGHSPRHHHHAPAALPLHGHGTASNSTREMQQAASAPSSGSGSRRSAPVSIPDWSKIYGRSKAGDDGEHNKDGGGEDDDDGEEERVPPHEWLARKMAGSCQVSSSVCEGAGRTLKGRDLSRVRNAVLSKTGFLEHLDDGHRH